MANPLSRILFGGGLKALGGAESFIHGYNKQTGEAISNLLDKYGHKKSEHKIPEKHTPNSDLIRNLLGYSEEELEGRNPVERGLQGVVGALPYALGGIGKGGAGLKQTGQRLLAGQAAKTTTEELGAPEWLQTAAQLGAEGLLTAKQNKLPSLEERKSKHYEAANKALTPGKKGKKNQGSAEPIKNFIEEAKKLHLTEPSEKTRQEVYKLAETLQSNIDSNGKIDIGNTWKILKNSRKLYKDSSESFRTYLAPVNKALDKILEDHKINNPKFYNERTAGNQIKKYQASNNIVRDWIDTSKGKFSTALKATQLPRVADMLETSWKIGKTPAVRSHYANLIDSIIKDNDKSAYRYAKLLTKDVAKAEQKNENLWEDVVAEQAWEDVE